MASFRGPTGGSTGPGGLRRWRESDAGAGPPTAAVKPAWEVEWEQVLEAAKSAEREVPDYIEADHGKMTAKFLRTPKLGDVPYAVQMQPSLVVEYYSR